MDGIVALGHFCETHGPVVIFCSQKSNVDCFEKQAHCLNAPVCDSCKSVDPEDAILSKDDDTFYASTRCPLKEDVAMLLKNATVRSISCEEMGKDGGVMYFGDDQRGHVITQTFYLADSMARGFKRKYSLMVLLADKIHLLNNWPHITKHFSKISSDLQEKANNVNRLEQANCSQKAARQASGKSNPGRSLQQLTGTDSIYLQIHMWFTWLLSINIYEEVQPEMEELPIVCPYAIKLRKLYKELPNEIFRKICYCFLTGIKVECPDNDIVMAFQQILPTNFKIPQTGECCKLIKKDTWEVQWRGHLPLKLPTLLLTIEDGLSNPNLPDEAMESYLISFSYHWYNISCDIHWSKVHSDELLKVLGVHKHDLPLLSYWTTQVRNNNV